MDSPLQSHHTIALVTTCVARCVVKVCGEHYLVVLEALMVVILVYYLLTKTIVKEGDCKMQFIDITSFYFVKNLFSILPQSHL